MECGDTIELSGIDEPETCVYTAHVKLPHVCDEKMGSKLGIQDIRHDEL